MKTTLNKIKSNFPTGQLWEKLLRYLEKTTADDEPLSILTILDSNGLDDALWALRTVEGHDREIKQYAIDCARDVQHLMRDSRSIHALDTYDRFVRGLATENELKSATDAAWDAADAAPIWSSKGYAARTIAWSLSWILTPGRRLCINSYPPEVDAAWEAAVSARLAKKGIEVKQKARLRQLCSSSC